MNHYEILHTADEIEFYGRKQKDWLAIGGIENPLFKTLVSRILKETPYINEYKLYVIGGLLEEWLSGDIDLALVGEYDGKKVKTILESILDIGWDLHMFLDLHFQTKLWRVDLYSRYGEVVCPPETMTCWRLGNYFKCGDYEQILHTEEEDGLHKQQISYPFPKHIERVSSGYVYSPPILLN